MVHFIEDIAWENKKFREKRKYTHSHTYTYCILYVIILYMREITKGLIFPFQVLKLVEK